MKPVIVHLKLPDDLSAKAVELAGDRPVKEIIIEALRAQWFPKIHLSQVAFYEKPEDFPLPAGDIYPIYGSIPAEQKRHA